jgi:hypothetical protein
MIDRISAKIVLTLLLNLADGIIAVALLLGGWNATNISAGTGYATIAGGLVLIYLSAGLWLEQKWKVLTRLILYLAASTALIIAFLTVYTHPRTGKFWPVPLVLSLLLVNLLVSFLHLRMTRTEAH